MTERPNPVVPERGGRPLPPPDGSWLALATYNAERSRGIVHTPEWVETMEGHQRAFDRQQMQRLTSEGSAQLSSGVWLTRTDRKRWWSRR